MSKYGNKKSNWGALSFDSALERSVYLLLLAMEQKGELEIEALQDQVKLTDAEIGYRADFRVRDLKLNEQVWVEAKGYPTETWAIKKRLWKVYGPGRLRIYVGRAGALRLDEEIIPKPRKLGVA